MSLSVLNNDNTVTANISTFILGTYSEPILFFTKTTKIVFKTINQFERAIFAKIYSFFTVLFD